MHAPRPINRALRPQANVSSWPWADLVKVLTPTPWVTNPRRLSKVGFTSNRV
jgi:hypothetical protein